MDFHGVLTHIQFFDHAFDDRDPESRSQPHRPHSQRVPNHRPIVMRRVSAAEAPEEARAREDPSGFIIFKSSTYRP
jgi:hypothetical protein